LSARAGSGALASVFRMNTRLFNNCLVDVSDAHAAQRPNGQTNSMLFIACHLVDSRYFVTRYLGVSEANPLERFLANATSIEDVSELPDLEQVRRAWQTIARTLEPCIDSLSESELKAPSPQRFPVDNPTIIGGIGFLLQHESYHIGQLALLRRFFGYPAMRYA
jgi:hypothetical protein